MNVYELNIRVCAFLYFIGESPLVNCWPLRLINPVNEMESQNFKY